MLVIEGGCRLLPTGCHLHLCVFEEAGVDYEQIGKREGDHQFVM